MDEHGSLFDLKEQTQSNLFDEQSTSAEKIDVVQLEIVGAESVSWKELFEGFDRLYAITYSSGLGFLFALLQKFQYAEVIFGFEEVMTYNLQEIVAYQIKTIERLRETSSKAKIDILDRINKQKAHQRKGFQKGYEID